MHNLNVVRLWKYAFSATGHWNEESPQRFNQLPLLWPGQSNKTEQTKKPMSYRSYYIIVIAIVTECVSLNLLLPLHLSQELERGLSEVTKLLKLISWLKPHILDHCLSRGSSSCTSRPFLLPFVDIQGTVKSLAVLPGLTMTAKWLGVLFVQSARLPFYLFPYMLCFAIYTPPRITKESGNL